MDFEDHTQSPDKGDGLPIVTAALAIANVIAWLHIISIADRSEARDVYLTYGLVPAEATFLALLTSMFLHADFWHLAGNLYFLVVFGTIVESNWGSRRFTALYFGGGIIAALAHWVIFPDSTVPVVGASGAIATLMGVVAVAFPSAQVNLFAFVGLWALGLGRVYVAASYVLLLWFLLQSVAFMSGSESDGVAWTAHVFGFIMGAVVAAKYRSRAERRRVQEEFDD